jgi:acylphosphatase
MMDHKRVYARVSGKVQGVAFREYTRREAARLGLSGWVGNLPDGTVEVMFEGPEEQTAVLLAWLASGSPFAVVTRIESYEETLLGETGPFIIR